MFLAVIDSPHNLQKKKKKKKTHFLQQAEVLGVPAKKTSPCCLGKTADKTTLVSKLGRLPSVM